MTEDFHNNAQDTGELILSPGSEQAEAVRLDERSGPVLHRDLAEIEPTDGIVINRTRSGLSPFTPIRKERLVDQLTGAPSRSYGVWVADPEREDGWRDVGTVSENYLLLPNADVRALSLEIAQASGMAFEESRIYWDGSRFAHVIDFVETREEVAEDDPVGLSLVTRSSYDKSWRYEAALMGTRFLCDNGLLSGEFFSRVAFKHVQGSGEGEPWQAVVRQGLAVLEHGERDLHAFAEALRRLHRTPMTDAHLRGIWEQLPHLTDTAAGRIIGRYAAFEEPTLFGLLNAGTNVFWHADKMTAADFSHNEKFVDGLLGYAKEHLN